MPGVLNIPNTARGEKAREAQLRLAKAAQARADDRRRQAAAARKAGGFGSGSDSGRDEGSGGSPAAGSAGPGPASPGRVKFTEPAAAEEDAADEPSSTAAAATHPLQPSAKPVIPGLSLGRIEEGTAGMEDRTKQRRATEHSLALGDLDQAKTQLAEDGIDMSLLTRAFQKIDDQNDGVLDISEFRNLWKFVFPQRPMDEASWRYTERIFYEIDSDQSGEVSWEEIVAYLNKSRRLVQRGKPPSTFQATVYRFVGQSEDAYDDVGSTQALLVAAFKFLSQLVVILSIVVLMVESLPSMQPRDSGDPPGSDTTFVIEACCIGFFTLELIAWVYSYPSQEVYEDKQGKRHVISATEEVYPPPSNVKTVRWRLLLRESLFYVDLLSILPFYIILLVGSSTRNASPLAAVRTLRLLRLLRILRILKLGRAGQKSTKVPELGAALKKSMMSLVFLAFLITIATVVSGTFIFYAELDQAHFDEHRQRWIRDADSEYLDAGEQTKFQSIPDALWWGVVTLTTVGYGDAYPSTTHGRIIAALTMLGGLIVIGYPITILTGTFQIMELERFEKEEKLDRCREFYNGIKRWVQETTEDDLADDNADGGGAEGEGGGGDGEDVSRKEGVSSTLKRPLSEQNKALLEMICQLEADITDKLLSIDSRVQRMERYDFGCTTLSKLAEDRDDSSWDSDSTSTVSSSTDTATTSSAASSAGGGRGGGGGVGG
eukprot:Rhum_TRINITY_DN14378_c5_g1::Rhum_TRINITY_DN14378_c5_g1_i1::g.84355::m.84355/K04886/KCNB2; potassium voltage-gated channel Shab-related subfamily B member 2